MKNNKLYLLCMLLLCLLVIASCNDNGSEPVNITPEQELKNRLDGEWISIYHFTNYLWKNKGVEPFSDSIIKTVIFDKNTDTIWTIGEDIDISADASPNSPKIKYYDTLTYETTGKYTFDTYRRYRLPSGYENSNCAVLFHSTDSITLTKFWPAPQPIVLNFYYLDITLHRRTK